MLVRRLAGCAASKGRDLVLSIRQLSTRAKEPRLRRGTRTVDSRRTHKRRLHHAGIFGTCIQHDLVDVPVEGMVREMRELIYPVPVIVHLVVAIAKYASIGVREGQDARAARVQPVPGLVRGMAGRQTRRDGFCGADMVGGVRRIC